VKRCSVLILVVVATGKGLEALLLFFFSFFLDLSPSQVESSVNSIKNLDLHRTLIMIKRNEDKV
jgi:hypothetical protein